MLITTGCAIVIAAAVFFSKPQPIRESKRAGTPFGLFVLAVFVLVPCVCWVVSPTDEPVSSRHRTAGEVSKLDPEAEQTVRELEATGFITSLDVEFNKVRVDAAMWLQLTLDQKHGIGSLLPRPRLSCIITDQICSQKPARPGHGLADSERPGHKESQS